MGTLAVVTCNPAVTSFTTMCAIAVTESKVCDLPKKTINTADSKVDSNIVNLVLYFLVHIV